MLVCPCRQNAHERMAVIESLHNPGVGEVVVDGPELVHHILPMVFFQTRPVLTGKLATSCTHMRTWQLSAIASAFSYGIVVESTRSPVKLTS